MVRGARPLTYFLSAAAVMGTMAAPFSVYVDINTNFAYRRQVIALFGIMPTAGGMAKEVTYAQFTQMLVRASVYRSVLTETDNVSVFTDVKSGDENAASIRLAAEQGWMIGCLGGKFKPAKPVRLNGAVKGVLSLLGYTADDFADDQFNKRMTQYASSDLNGNIGYGDPQTELTETGCVNPFYNLMKAEQKSGTVYATVLNAEVDAKGEVNTLKTTDSMMQGPKIAESRTQVNNIIPLRLDDATIFMNGKEVQKGALCTAATQYVVICYSSKTKTVWAYSADTDLDADRRVARGVVKAVCYQNTSTPTPNAVKLDDDNVYQLSSTGIQFVFSVYGSMKVDDHVVLICQVSSNGTAADDEEGNQKFSVVDYMEPQGRRGQAVAGEVEPKKKRLSKGTRRNIRRAVIALTMIGIDGAVVHNRMEAAKKAALANVAAGTDTVTREDISQKISSTGAIAAKDTYSITSLVSSGTITETNFEIGDHVVKDQVLYRFDSALMVLSVKDAENALPRARKAFTNVQADLSGTQSRYGDGICKAARADYVTKIYVTDGKRISTSSSLVDLAGETTMNVRIPFLSGEIELIRVGSPAALTFSDTMEQVEGTVTAVGAQGKTLSGGRLVKGVTVSLKNPGGITSSTTASAVINGFCYVEEGKFEAQLSSSMTADPGGAVDSVNILVHVGDYIQPGASVLMVTAKSVKSTLQGYSGKVGVAESDVESAQKALNSAKGTLNNCMIKSPIDGEVMTKSHKVGDKIDGTSVSGRQSATMLATIYDVSSYNFKITIDEADVSKIQLGQHVEITADALPGETFSETVTSVDLESTSQNGVSTCPVQVTLDNTEKLLPGMNINAEILVGSAENTPCTPADALLRDNKVYVRDPSMTEAKGVVLVGFRRETVEIGLVSAGKVQITSGNLKGGDEVYMQLKVTDSGMMMMNGRAVEGGGDSGAEDAEGGGQQSGGDQGGGENRQG